MYNPTQRLMRSRTDKVIAGVAGGIGQYLAIDPVIVRLAFVALCFTGVGVLLYPVLWLIMPVEGGQHPGFVRTETGVQIHQYAVFHKESNFACVVVTPEPHAMPDPIIAAARVGKTECHVSSCVLRL